MRKVGSLGLIVLFLLVARYVAPPAALRLGVQSEILRTLTARQTTYADAAEGLEAHANRRLAEVNRRPPHARGSHAQLRVRRDPIEPRIAVQPAGWLSLPRLTIAAARGHSAAVLGHYRARAEIALLERERRQIDALLTGRFAKRESLRLEAQRRAAVGQLRTSHADRLSVHSRINRNQGRPLAGPRNAVCRLNPLEIGCRNYRALLAARGDAADATARNRDARARLTAIAQAEEGLVRAGARMEDAEVVLARQQAAIASELMPE